MTECFGFVEDAPSAEIAKRLLAQANETSRAQLQFRDGSPYITGGVGNIRKNIEAYLNMARKGLRIIVLVDLDATACAPKLLHKWFSVRLPESLIFRIAVHEIESWVMADRSNLAKFLNISVDNFPLKPDELTKPKKHLLDIIRRRGRKGWHKEMLPQGRTASIGPKYNEKICDFIEKHWNPIQAARNSASLTKAIAAFERSHQPGE